MFPKHKKNAALLALAGVLTGAAAASAATPAAGTITPLQKTATYAAGPFLLSNPTAQAGDQPQCTALTPCDDYTLTVALPSNYAAKHPRDVLAINVQWPTSVNDFDVYVLDAAGNVVKTAATSNDPEKLLIPAGSGSYTLTVRVAPFAVTGDSFTGTIALTTLPAPPAPGTATVPKYKNFVAPDGLGVDAGEPSIGANWKTGRAMFQAGLQTLRVAFDDSTSTPRTNWTLAQSPITSTTSLDPILFTDSTTGRTFVSQLTGACSLSAYTNDDGLRWTPSEGCGTPAGVDHQTIGGGAYAPLPGVGAVANPVYAHTVYYCSQDAVTAICARSDDGGLTYGPGIPIYNLTQCGGLHGHVKAAPDGTVYVPNKSCGAAQGVVVSEDNGLTWSVRPVPTSTSADSDPSVGLGANGTVYFGYQNGDGHAHVAVSRNRGQSWTNDQDVGGYRGVQNIVFPAVVAGDDERAAFAFLGTSTGGNYQDTANFGGAWYLWVSHTYDGGKSWVTGNATSTDPVQRGSICTGGTLCGNDRNLLDFMDATVDSRGRVLVGYADGCTGACVAAAPNSFSALGTIARQSTGKGVFAAWDNY